MAHQQKTAIRRATADGTMNAARQVCSIPRPAKMTSPRETRRPREPPPKVWEVFHTDILKLRSFCENQYAMTLPQGGHPMPESHPMISIRMKIRVTLTTWLAPNGMKPTAIMVRAESTSPTTRNFLASERSDTLPMMNLLNA